MPTQGEGAQGELDHLSLSLKLLKWLHLLGNDQMEVSAINERNVKYLAHYRNVIILTLESASR